MVELIFLSRLRTEVWLRENERSHFRRRRAAGLAQWVMPVAPGPALQRGEACVLRRDLHADARTFRSR
jgi:hypothetical protein